MKRIATLLTLVLSIVLTQAAFAQTTISTGKYTTAATLDADANIYALQFDAANGHYDVVKYDAPGYIIPTVLYNGLVNGSELPGDIGIASNGDVYVVDGHDGGPNNGRLIVLDASNSYASSIIASGEYYSSLGIDSNDDIFVAQYDGSSTYEVVKYDVSNSYSTSVIFSGLGTSSPYSRGLTIDQDDNIYVSTDYTINDGTIYKLTSPGYSSSVIDSGEYYTGLAVDGHGDLFAMAYDSADDDYDVVKYTGGSGSPTVFHNGLQNTSSDLYGLGSNRALGDLVIPDTWDSNNGTLYYYDRTDPVTDDADGNLTAGSGVSEPVGIASTLDTSGEAIDIFDFTLSDGGGSDGLAMSVSEITVNVSGTSTDAERADITWRLNGNDASNVTGTYDAGADQITFTGLSISIADGGSETYTINAYYNDNSSLTEDRTIILSVDGDTDVTTGSGGTSMGTTSAVTNGSGSTIDITASQLAFTTQPASSTSGSALGTQPVVTAQDAFGNTDVDFTETVTLTESSAGTLSGDIDITASSGVATFTDVAYTATADQESFTLTANDEDGSGSDLSTVDANSVSSDVVATKLVFDTEPAPTTVEDGTATDMTTDPVVKAVDANDVVDTGYSTDIALAEVNGAGSATMTGTGDTDGSGSTVTITPSSGASTFTDLQLTYTASGSSDETFNLQASSGGLTTVNSTQLTAVVNNPPTVSGLPSDITVTEDTESNVDLSSAVFGDSDGDNITVTFTASAGTFSTPADGSGVGAGVTETLVSATEITLAGAPGDINTYLDTNTNIKYTGASNVSGNDAATITVEANDGNGSGDVNLGTVNLDITNVNDNPTLAGLPSDVTVTEDTESNVDLSSSVFGDVDGDNITVTLTASAGTFSSPADGSGVGSGVTETKLSATEITLAGAVGDINTYLDTNTNIKYTGNADVNGDNAATISVEANDGNGSGDVSFGSLNLDITAVNDSPTLTGLPSDVSITEDTESNVDLSSAVFEDADGDDITVTFTASAGTFSSPADGSGVTETLVSSTVITLAGSAGDINTYLDTNTNIKYTGAANVSGDDAATITVEANDGNGSGDVTLGTVNLDISGVNDEPTLTATANDPSFTEGDPAPGADLYNGVAASTVEAGQSISGLTLTVANVSDGSSEILRFDGSDIALTDGNTVTTANNSLSVNISLTSSTATVSFSGASLTNAQAQSLVDGLAYRNSSADPTTGSNRIVTITEITDNGGTTNGGDDTAALSLSSTVSITAVNDAPSITNLAGDNAGVQAGGNAVHIDDGEDVTVSNTDSPDYNGGLLEITDKGNNNTANGDFEVDGTNVTAGGDATIAAGETIAVGGTSVGTVAATNDGQGGNTLTITFNANATSARIQTIIRNMRWGAAAGSGTQTFTLTVSDNDGTANGGDEDAAADFSMTLGNPPVVDNLDGDTVDFEVGGSAVNLDDGGNATLSDADSPANLNGGNLHVTVSGNADAAEDLLQLNTGGTVSVSGTTAGSNVSVGGTVIGTLANNIAVGNDLRINLTANSTIVGVEELLRAIQYENTASPVSVFSREVSVTLTDNDGLSSSTSTVFVNLAGNPPIMISSDVTKTIDEHTASGTSITDSDAKDGDGGAADANMSYAISSGNQDYNGNGSSAFTIDNEGKVTVDDASDLDYEGTQTFSLTIEATDTFNQSVTQSVTVNLNDLAETFVVDGDSQDSFDGKSEAEERSDGGGLDVYEAIGLAQVESASLDTIRIKEPLTSSSQIFVSGKSRQVHAVMEVASGVTRTGTNGAYIFSSDNNSSFYQIINNGTLEQGQGSSVDPVPVFNIKNTTLTNGFENNGLIRNDFGAATHQAIIIDQGSTIDGDVTNSGTITGAATGIDIQTAINGVFLNSGTITGETYGGYIAKDISGDVTNSGTMTAVSGSALRIDGAINGTLINASSGTLESSNGVALQLGSADHTVINRGDLTGGNGTAIELGDGNDTFTAESGVISGAIEGGAGKDQLNGRNADEEFNGGTGDDIIEPGEGSDTITFGDGQDDVRGTAQELGGDTITDATNGNTIVLRGETGFSYPATVRTTKDQLEIDLNQDGFGNADDIIIDAPGIESFLMVVTDDGTDTRITITDNNAPVISSGNAANVDENSSGTVLDVEATDGEGNDPDQNINYTLSGTDSGLFSINTQTGEIAFKNTPDYESPADDNTDNSYEVTVEANDGIVTVSQAITIKVNEVNESPTITAIKDQTINEGSSTSAIKFTISDVDNTFGELNVTATSSNQTLLPNANIALGGSDGNRTITLDPAAYQNGNTTVTLSVSDGSLSQSTSFELTVSAVNDEPVISGTPDKTINEDVAYSFTPSASDQEDDNLSFMIQNKPSWLTFDKNTGTLTGTPLNEDVGVYKDITITVSDGNGGSASLPAYDLTVQNVNDAPVVDAGIDDQTTIQNQSFKFSIPANAFDDVDDGDVLTLSVTNLPDGISFDAGNNIISGIATGVDLGANTVTVKAEDQAGKTVSTSFNLEVLAEIPDRVTLKSPADESGSISLDAELSWKAVTGATSYEIQIAKDNGFSDLVISEKDITSPSFILSGNLADNSNYYWRVRASNSAGNGDWSESWSFMTIASAPTLVFPADNESNISIAPELSWQSGYDDISYRVQVATNVQLQSTLVDTLVESSTLYLEGLKKDTEYYWQVRVESNGTTSPYSTINMFTSRAPSQEEVPEEQITFSEGGSGGSSRSLESNDYRLVGLPGDTDVPVEELFEGQYGKDWKVFADNGAEEDFLVEHSKENPFTFSEGKGYWVLSKKALTVGGEITPVSVSEKDTYSITLNPGWNIISNPYAQPSTWQEVLQFNQLNLTLFGYDGSFYESSEMTPFYAYYVYNDEANKIELEIPYTSLAKRAGEKKKTDSKKLKSKPGKITLTIDMEGRKRPAKVHMVYEPGKDKQKAHTKYMPPLELSRFGAGIVNEDNPKRKKLLHTVGDAFDRERKHYTVEVKAGKREKIMWTPEILGFDNNLAVLVVEPKRGRTKILSHDESYPFMTAKGRKSFEVYIGTVAELQDVKQGLIPQKISLNQNYPNPFNPATTIQFGIDKRSDVTLEVFDILGRKVQTLLNGQMKGGWHKVRFNGRRLASGTYFYRLIVGQKVQTKKMVLIK